MATPSQQPRLCLALRETIQSDALPPLIGCRKVVFQFQCPHAVQPAEPNSERARRSAFPNRSGARDLVCPESQLGAAATGRQGGARASSNYSASAQEVGELLFTTTFMHGRVQSKTCLI